MTRLAGEVAVVTGAALGIGAAVAKRFAEEGATLALVDMDAERLRRTVESMGAHGQIPVALTVDVTDERAVEDAFAQVAAAHGRINVLVNNVGGARNAKLWG
jgi:3-oxoacyl-[acyl-carrier protein] reductase